MAEEQAPQAYRELPTWAKTLTQLGFASALIVFVFVSNREDRGFLREQLSEERRLFRETVVVLDKAINSLDESQRLLKKLDDDRNPFLAPPPKLKPTP